MNRCFAIGPIGNKFAPIGSSGREAWEDALQVYENVILPACKANGLEPVRADQIAVAGEITDQVFRHLLEDEVVIADVSGGNPNVMYELGLRHTTGLLTIQIGEFGQLPFDVAAVRSIMFSRSERGLVDARKELEQALAVGLAEGPDPVTAARVWSSLRGDVTAVAEPASPTNETVADEDDDDDSEGLLERMQAIEEAFPRMTVLSERISEILERLGEEAMTANREMDLINATGGPTKKRLTTVAKFASALQPPADDLSAATDAFAEEMENIDAGVRGILAYLESGPEAGHNKEVDDFLEQVESLAQSSRGAMESLGQFAGVVASLGSVSKTLRRPGKQMAEAVRKMATATAVMDDWESDAHRARLTRASKQPDED